MTVLELLIVALLLALNLLAWGTVAGLVWLVWWAITA